MHVLEIVYSFIIMTKWKTVWWRKMCRSIFANFRLIVEYLTRYFRSSFVIASIKGRRNISIMSSSYLPYLFLMLRILHYYRVNMLNHVLFALSVFITVISILFLYPVCMLREFGVSILDWLIVQFFKCSGGSARVKQCQSWAHLGCLYTCYKQVNIRIIPRSFQQAKVILTLVVTNSAARLSLNCSNEQRHI